MFEDFVNALQNFKTNKTRTFLSLLGIVIGVTSVIIVTTMGSSLYKSLAGQFNDFSMDMITLSPQWNRSTNKPYIELNDEYRTTLIREIPEIKNVFYTNTFDANVIRADLSVGSKQIQAIEPERLETLKLKIDYGGLFSPSDFVNGFQKAIIGDQIAKELFPEGNAVGKRMTLQIKSSNEHVPPYNFSFEVIGVLTPKNNWLIQSSQSVYVPRKFYADKLAVAGERSTVWNAEVSVYRAQDSGKVESKIKKISQELGGGYPYAVWTYSAQKDFEQFSKIMNMVRLVLSCVAGISLLVGGIGIMNIMLVTVTERKKEIGIRKALGASNRAILNQFLIESATLTLTGGTIGVLIGIFISKAIVKFFFPAEFVFALNATGTLIAFAVSVSIGVFFGLHPALKAAKLDPVVALAD
ncbi:ABC transporter permease [Treponema brennaborense]|uniref:Uncharacterized protein n=1 Tax=Treponema brennaborense (strain DSM 12168 / CIP 105900 / DD5/3) TaxID=906968 RepID=F4LJ50_TREBD|nr:ABC transporter permease [Treponema brennaborense]AEE16307.1 protein of unknown function DUF214 [Treponema brennaborense DSM 12168]